MCVDVDVVMSDFANRFLLCVHNIVLRRKNRNDTLALQ